MTGVKRRNTVTAAVLEVKNSPVIVSNISAQDIKLTQDANAGEVIRRVPGVSLIDDKFVMVRGLAQRYNNVWMNGGAVPSSEADQRAFSFDMIPSNQIDNLTIVKSPTPEYPADYTGGFIMIDTKEIPLENAFHVSVGGNWNSASAFKSFLGTKQSGADFLGFDNGLCSLHGGIDATLADLGKNSGGNTMYSLSDNHLNNDWTVKNQHPWGDLKLSADWSHSWTLPAGKLGAIAAVNYTNDIHAGVRFEYNRMELISNTKSYETSHESHYYRHSDLFPSANATYKLDEKNQIRLSYGRSVNRPEFREVSPSVYYDFDLASNVEGNFNLKNCYVDNLDVRYEWYPSRGEMISLAAFYKHFDSPIEWVYTMSGGTDVIYSYANARSANNYGLELDVRKNLAFMGLPDFNWSFNGSLIHSRVNFEPGSNEESRAMQGQSPYLVNTGLFYKNRPLALDIALLYNRIGKRIVGIGRAEGMDRSVKVPNSYEMPRDAFDLTVSKRFGERIEVKLAARDLLNQNIIFKQFTTVSLNVSSKKVQEVTRRYKPGRNLQATVIVKL